VSPKSAERDYSHVPLWRKLGIREGARLALAGAPATLLGALGELPAGVEVVEAPAASSDVVLWFPASAAELASRFAMLRATLHYDGGLWVAWPKRASRVPTELDFALVQRIGLDTGLVDNKGCSIDSVFSGLRFVYRRADRPPR
jgi:hypothetical protein